MLVKYDRLARGNSKTGLLEGHLQYSSLDQLGMGRLRRTVVADLCLALEGTLRWLNQPVKPVCP